MINRTMQQSGHPPARFHGFMADEAEANWCGVRTVFNGGPKNVMEERERTCLFHWKQSLLKHTKQCVMKERQHEHINLCEGWRLASSKEEAMLKGKEIREWWRKGHVGEQKISLMDAWMSWWEVRIAHWGSLMARVVLSPEDVAHTPRTNLSESVHGSWLAGEGYKEKISLYDACISDMANALLQSAKQYAYQMGKHKGEGPSLSKLMERVAARTTPTPPQVARMVQEAVAGTPMYEETRTLHGDKETIQRKRVRATENDQIDNCSHRPGYVMESRQRATKGRPRRVIFGGDRAAKGAIDKTPREGIKRPTAGNHQENEKVIEENSTATGEALIVVEEAIGRTMWAIRRTPLNSKVKCLGGIDGKNKCKAYIHGSSIGVVAPCFHSERRHPGVGGPKPQMMWFCPSDVSHTWHVDPNIVYKPSYPNVWKVDIGTNITPEEIEKLSKAGFKLDLKHQQLFGSSQGESSGIATRKGKGGEGGQHAAINTKRSSKWRHGISHEAEKRVSSAEAMLAIVIDESAMHPPPYTIFHLACESGKEYFVHIKEEPWCTCPDFMQREAKGKSYLACKHIYFVYMRVLGLQKNEDMVMHQPTLPREDLSKMLSRPRNKEVCAHI